MHGSHVVGFSELGCYATGEVGGGRVKVKASERGSGPEGIQCAEAASSRFAALRSKCCATPRSGADPSVSGSRFWLEA
jgi:hypothetical protein